MGRSTTSQRTTVLLPAGIDVDVYFNLHKKLFSVRARTGENKNWVIAETETLTLRQACFVVNELGRQRSLQTGAKSVHAFVSGVTTELVSPAPDAIQVTYRPAAGPHFFDPATGIDVLSADAVTLTVEDRKPRVAIVEN